MTAKAPRGLAYIRVSTDKQTVENQRIQIKSYAKGRGLELADRDWFEDPETSGTVSPVKRPGFSAMLQLLKKSPPADRPKNVVVYEISRIGRNFWEILEAIKTVEDLAPIISTSPKEWFVQIEDKSMRNLLLAILAWGAERERDMLVQRTREGVKRAKMQNHHAGHKPLGYTQHVCAKMGHDHRGCPLDGKLQLDALGKKALQMLAIDPDVAPRLVKKELGLRDSKQAWNLLRSVRKFGLLLPPDAPVYRRVANPQARPTP